MSRKTKLICTLGPATESEEMIGKLMDAGTDVFRLNMSHAKHEWAADLVKKVRRQAQQRNAYIAVLFDLTGPSIRTGDLPQPFTLAEGDIVEFRKEGTEATVEKSTTVNYDGLMGDVAVGNTLVVDNGALLMRIDAVEADRILCNVQDTRHHGLPPPHQPARRPPESPRPHGKGPQGSGPRRRVRGGLHRRIVR